MDSGLEHTMHSTLRNLLLVIAGAGLAGHAWALDAAAATELAKANGCFSCHSAKEKVVGPAYSAVADKYKGDKDAVAHLTQSIQMGSQGKWGRIPMPAHPNMSVADIKALAQWILSTKH